MDEILNWSIRFKRGFERHVPHFLPGQPALSREPICGRDGGFLIVQSNPGRVARLAQPPLPAELVGLSRLDLRVIAHQSGYRQYPDRLEINRRPYAGLPSPYGFGMYPTTVVSLIAGDSQDYGSADRFHRIALDLCVLAARAADFVAMWNGRDAGATVPEAQHYSLIDRQSAIWPLELAAARAESSPGESVTWIAESELFPVVAARVRGSAEEVADIAKRLAMGWHAQAGGRATENMIATASCGLVTLYYVPRDSSRECESVGDVRFRLGSLEMLGELVCGRSPAPSEFRRYDALHRALSGARPTNVKLQL
jgi:hypothetical protein